jgi:L-seryl-tRNA(Ser) seleniumtransferase
MNGFRVIPSIEEFLQRPAVKLAADRHGRAHVADAARIAATELRSALADGRQPYDSPEEAERWMESRVLAALAGAAAPSLVRVINATGVIVHTNLGRAPLARSAIDRIAETVGGYSNLEYDLASGGRGHRHVHAERLLCQLSGAAAAAVVNNNAAATLLALSAVAAGREVIVSRGELVEIGGGFRVPEIMSQSGAVLREVGTTNRTRIADYAASIGDRTALVLRVHPSNFRVEGFTERPAVRDLAAMCARFNIPLFEDLGSGWLGLGAAPDGLAHEPSVRASIDAGVDLVAFSGDKLLGGPQAGLIVGNAALVERLRRHPLMRAVRADKLTYAALEATLSDWSMESTRARIPVARMLAAAPAELNRRAALLAERLSQLPRVHAAAIDGSSTIGGGSAPGSKLPTRLVAVQMDGLSAAGLEARLRAATPPVVARILDDRVVIDVRTMTDEEDDELAHLVGAIDATRPER